MAVGILIGFVLILLCIVIAISPTKTSIKKISISLCIGFAMFIASIFVGHYIEVEISHKYIASYSIKKETIEILKEYNSPTCQFHIENVVMKLLDDEKSKLFD